MALGERLVFLLTANGTQAISEFGKVGAASERSLAVTEAGTKRTAANLTRLGVGFVTMGGLAAFGMYKAAQAASAQVEAQNKVNVVFGDSADVVNDFADSSAAAFGISEEGALSAAGAFGNMFTAMGIADDRAAEMSVGLTQLAADMASFNDEDPTVMLEKIQSGMSGQMRSLREYGSVLSATRVNEYAWAQGIAATGEALTESEKLIARYGLLMQDTARQQGDFARTLEDSAANQMRVLSAQWDDLVSTLGTAALPVLQRVTTGLTHLVGGLNAADAATGGFIGQLAAWGTVGALAAGGTLLLAGQVLKLGATFRTLSNTTMGVRLGLLAMNPGFGAVAAAVAVAAAAYAAFESTSKSMSDNVTVDMQALAAATEGELVSSLRHTLAAMAALGETDAVFVGLAQAAEQDIVAAENLGNAMKELGLDAGRVDDILGLFDEQLVLRVNTRNRDGSQSLIELPRDEFARSAAAAVANLSEFQQQRPNTDARPLEPGRCDRIAVRSVSIEQGRQGGTPYRFESLEEYVLEQRGQHWIAIKAESTQR